MTESTEVNRFGPKVWVESDGKLQNTTVKDAKTNTAFVFSDVKVHIGLSGSTVELTLPQPARAPMIEVAGTIIKINTEMSWHFGMAHDPPLNVDLLTIREDGILRFERFENRERTVGSLIVYWAIPPWPPQSWAPAMEMSR